ncbi:unnamed protein product [Brachionus calyciflorus]|uniref:RING-type domain-containing protein n=1 Tax=Brachionus calyciflorus TaxID=104777 RepID=A0A814ATN9_9BILA|nr:unnamed protein product [Brachionus calyciflorus]
MHRTLSLKIGELNSYLKCPLCKGYLIDSYTINECLHSFCKSCIIKYIKRKECCPTCKINIIKDRMSNYLKRDVNLQCIVYKIVPELFKKEMKRRREFYTKHPKALKFLKKKKLMDKETIGELEDDIFLLNEYTDISLSIEYSDTGLAEICESARYKELDPPSPKTYLQCSASLSIELLKKFLSIKFDLKTVKNLDIMYDDKPLNKELTLLDVSYIYAWRRTAPMRLFYRVNKEEEEDKINTSIPNNILASIDNNVSRKETETNEDKIVNKSLDENFKSENIEENFAKPTAKSTPQKDELSQSRLQIDLSVNESAKDNLENSVRNTSNLPALNQINTSHNLNNNNNENLTITALVASITNKNNLNKLETVSNSDKENEEENQVSKIEQNNSEVDLGIKNKKVKSQKNKLDEDETNKKKKANNKPTDSNPNKKQKISDVKKIENETSEALTIQQQFNLPFSSNKINSQSICPNYPSNPTTPQPQLQMLQNFQLMPLMYPWKNPFDYSQNFQTSQTQQQNNNMNPYLNQKYASQIFDFFQNKSQPYPNYAYQGQNTTLSQYAQANSNLNNFNQYGYNMDEFKKPLANFASFIQEAASYQNNLFSNGSKLNGQINEQMNSNTSSSGLDSLKETQMKISESCSLVND